MHIRILGSAAGGRFPQWNCGCGNCVGVRKNVRKNDPESFRGKARTQAQLALSADGSAWFLVGACPDLAFQIENSPELHPRALPKTPRDSPIAGVVLASCDLDHVVGLLLLRELQPLRVYAAPSILRILREENSMFGMLNRVEPQVVWTPMQAGAPFPLLSADGKDSGLRCEVRYVSGRYPKYVKNAVAELGREEATAIYPEWRGGYYFAGKRKVGKSADKSAPIAVLYISRWSSPAKAAEFAAVYAKSLAQRYQKRQGLGTDGKAAEDAPPADSWRTLRGRHAWMTEEGIVVIEVRGDEILISESLDDATTKKVEADFWPEERPEEKAAPGKP